MNTGQSSQRLYATADAAEAFVRGLLAPHGMPGEHAEILAKELVRADLRGVDTHGIILLLSYLKRIRLGLINPHPELIIEKKTCVAGHLDGQNGCGVVVATKAMAGAIDMAREFGLGLVSVKRSTHFGMAAAYVLQAVEAGFISLVFTNASRGLAPFGSRQAFLGTSPFAAGAPAGGQVPYVLDMSPAVVARGKIRRAVRRGEPIPEGWALDTEGRATTDPEEAVKGALLPIGGPKGSAISMLMDILGGVISGAAYAGDVGNQFADYDRPQDVGHFFLALKPDLFMSAADYRERMDTLAERIHGCEPAHGFSEVLMPGEMEGRTEQERRRLGIPYNPQDVAKLQAEAESVGAPKLEVSPTPFGA